MIAIYDKDFESVEEALAYFEPSISRITNKYLGNHSAKDDCKQELRLAVWKLYDSTEKRVNSLYVVNRLRWNTINFINRDAGFKWSSKFVSLDKFTEPEVDYLMSKAESNTCIETDKLLLKDIIERASGLLSFGQREALTVFLSGAPSVMIRKFYGIKGKHLTKYYLLLAEALGILKEVSNDDD